MIRKEASVILISYLSLIGDSVTVTKSGRTVNIAVRVRGG